MTRKEIYFEEADGQDAVAFQEFMQAVYQETDYLVLDELSSAFSEDELVEVLEAFLEDRGKLILLAKLEEQVIGVVSVNSSTQYRISHIGTLFLAVRKDYWGQGIGQILLEEVLTWASEEGLLKRLELTVQVRNERAVHLYEKMGFEREGIQQRGARTDKGEWLDLYYMGRLIDEQ